MPVRVQVGCRTCLYAVMCSTSSITPLTPREVLFVGVAVLGVLAVVLLVGS